MVDIKNGELPLVHLHYKKGELIMKEGDYGISIYKVINGHVRVTKQTGDTEVSLATLGPGEIFGEMVFLNKLVEARSASVRAVDDVDIEVWHPARLTKEYDQMSPILKYIINQTLTRLVRMNKVYSHLKQKKKEEKEKGEPKEAWASQRMYYRKEFDKTCVYRPVRTKSKVRLQGRITDISVGGAGLDVSAKNALNFSHKPGDKFAISTKLPSGQMLDLVGVIKSVKKSQIPGRMQLGLKFEGLTGDATKKLGFFMMS